MERPDAETMRAWTSLLVAHRRLTTRLDEELRERTGLTLDEYDVLHQLRVAGTPLRMNELADRVLITRPTTTRLVDRLVTRGWVERSADAGDRRVVRVSLSSEGLAELRVAGRVHADGIARLFGRPLEGTDVAGLADALTAVAALDGRTLDP